MNYLTWGLDWICRIYAPTADQSYLFACAYDTGSSDKSGKENIAAKHVGPSKRELDHSVPNGPVETDIRLH